MVTQADLKSRSRSVTVLEYEVETLQTEMESVKRMAEEIITQCSVSARQGSNFARYVNKKVPGRFQALALTV